MSERADQPLSEYLSELRARAGMSLEEVAREAGYKGRSSVQRYFEDPDIEVLSPKIATKLAKALYQKGDPQISATELIRLIVKDPHNSSAMGDQLTAFLGLIHKPGHGPQPVEYRIGGMIPVVGSAYASNWMEQAPSIDEPESWLPIPFANSEAANTLYAIRVLGPSINRVAQEGHYAICQRQYEKHERFPSGCFVHVERDKDGLIEWTIKKIRWKGDIVLLCPDSDHQSHQSPIELGGSDHKITVRGLVVGWYKPA